MANIIKKQISKDIRNSIYKQAKEHYIENGIYKTGICFSCIQILMRYGIEIKRHNFYDLYEFLPEMLLVKPNSKRNYFWWEVNQIKRRLNAFDKMIKLTE
jgi:hypothetical protein